MTEVVNHESYVLDADGNTAEDILQEVLEDDPDEAALAFLGHRFETKGEVPVSDGSCCNCTGCIPSCYACNCHL
jgi:hypothetical protein